MWKHAWERTHRCIHTCKYAHARKHTPWIWTLSFPQGNAGFLIWCKQMLVLIESTTPLRWHEWVFVCVWVRIWATIHLPPSVLVRWNILRWFPTWIYFALMLFMLLSFTKTLKWKACFSPQVTYSSASLYFQSGIDIPLLSVFFFQPRVFICLFQFV